MDVFRLSDLLNLKAVQKMAESLYDATGMPVGIIDAFDNSILVGVGWQDICLGFHRANADSLRRCQASDMYIKQNLKVGEVRRYKCKNGLWDIGIPVVVEEKHLATLFIGQFFYEEEKPEKEFFIEQARRFDYDLDAYLKALEQVPIFKNEKVEYILEYDKALVGFLIDLAEQSISRKRAENKLLEARIYISNLIDSMPSLLIGVDNDGKITQWNKTAELTTGLAYEKVVLQPIENALPRLKGKLVQIKEAIKKQEVIRDLKVPRTGEAETRYEDITIFPLTDGKMEGAVIRIDDVTEKVRMEEVLIQNEKMLSVGGLAAGMAHEINNPLAGVILNINVLENRLTSNTIPANIKAAASVGTTMESIFEFINSRDIPRMIGAIKDSGSRIASIVENMLSFARKGDSSFSSHQPAALLDGILDLACTDYDLKKQYNFKAISIQKEYEADLPMIACEGSTIQQVLLNILNNGAYAMFTRKKMEDTPPPKFILRLSHLIESGVLQIEVEDNGIGIDEAIRKRIFEPFFTTKPIGVGTGLGLSVSYFIITEKHKGTIDVITEPGKGSNFIIRLPVEKKMDSN